MGQGCGFGCPGQGTHICSWQPVGPCRSVDVGRDAFVSTSVVKGHRLSVAKLDCAGPFIATAVLDRSATIRWERSAVGDKLGTRSAKERRVYSERHSGCRVSGRQSTRGEIPLRIPAVHDVWCMGVRAEADWCPCRRRLDGLIATVGRCEEWHLFGKCGRGYRVSGRQSTRGEIPLRIPAVHDVQCTD